MSSVIDDIIHPIRDSNPGPPDISMNRGPTLNNITDSSTLVQESPLLKLNHNNYKFVVKRSCKSLALYQLS